MSTINSSRNETAEWIVTVFEKHKKTRTHKKKRREHRKRRETSKCMADQPSTTSKTFGSADIKRTIWYRVRAQGARDATTDTCNKRMQLKSKSKNAQKNVVTRRIIFPRKRADAHEPHAKLKNNPCVRSLVGGRWRGVTSRARWRNTSIEQKPALVHSYLVHY